MPNRKICVITGTRAEYGLLFWLMRDIQNDPSMTLQLIVTGTHLEPAFGYTVDVIEADGFHIDARVPIELTVDTPSSIAKSTGLATAGIAEALETLTPDIVVLLGDRFEILAAATAATICNTPIAHIHGGEITEGAIDDAIRHAITKLSALHFPAADEYHNRIVQMGAQPETVITVGAPGLDHIARTELLDAAATYDALGLKFNDPYFLITLHPTTRGQTQVDSEVTALIDTLSEFPDHTAIFTGVNADAGRDVITDTISTFVTASPSRARAFASLGQVHYLSAMKHADIIIGNSSSGIIEAPAFDVPTVNIGDRQKGRLRAASIINTVPEKSPIYLAISKALSPAFRASYQNQVCQYGMPGASAKIANALRSFDLNHLARQPFYNIDLDQAVS